MDHRIVHVCGTMGSGKTTLIRNWMATRSCPWVADTGGRKLPIGYVSDTAGHRVFVAGAYEDGLQTSGCDTIKDTPAAYALVLEHFRRGESVVYEGLFMMNHTRGLQLLRDSNHAVVVIHLSTSIDECRAGVVDRRLAQGNTEPLPTRFEDGLSGNYVRAANYARKMRAAGGTVLRCSRDEAAARLGELLA